MTDEELMKKIRKKDMSAFDFIMERYNKLLWLVVGNILEKAGTAEDVEDCISDVYVKLLENPKIYDYRKGSLKSFLVRVAKNLAVDRYRKLTRNNIAETEHQEAFCDDDALQTVFRSENKARILEALDAMKEPDREIIVRRFIFDEKIKVISEKMNMQAKQVENRLYQSKLKLRETLEGQEG